MPCDARNLAEHCSTYVIPEKELTNMEPETGGNVFVVFSADYGGRRVVIKRWHGAVVPNDQRVQFTKRLIRDLDLWRTLNHPNIAPVLGVALHVANLPALVVPELRTVNQVLKENPYTNVTQLMCGIAAGLTYLHAQTPPITLGDLKGSSVYLSPSGTPLLSDIGVASIPQPPYWSYSDVEDARWRAPEVADPRLRPAQSEPEWSTHGTPDSTSPLAPESDVHAFGMLSYEMHTRARPFNNTRHSTDVILLVATGHRPPRPSREQSPQLTDELWDVIQMCWKQDWKERPTMPVVLALLETLKRTARLRDFDGLATNRRTLV
ncbi:kinase-like domain-containing protein [Mycena metata]|uniref:Kinase-like domain-containing protein n=1 Tax=Mycena metata TaxID=1033252 RepID=A0AAD7HF55_9AGAR|nr:kinase-like domain-containing protein [Mycena metata]